MDVFKTMLRLSFAGVEIFRSRNPQFHTLNLRKNCFLRRARAAGDGRLYFVINLIGPNSPHEHLVLYFAFDESPDPAPSVSAGADDTVTTPASTATGSSPFVPMLRQAEVESVLEDMDLGISRTQARLCRRNSGKAGSSGSASKPAVHVPWRSEGPKTKVNQVLGDNHVVSALWEDFFNGSYAFRDSRFKVCVAILHIVVFYVFCCLVLLR